jgi:hypothetical protein
MYYFTDLAHCSIKYYLVTTHKEYRQNGFTQILLSLFA